MIFEHVEKFSVVSIDPLGCMANFGDVCSCVRSVGDTVWRNDMLPPLLSRPVVIRFCGLVQTGVVFNKFTK